MRILIVEDQPDLLAILLAFLESEMPEANIFGCDNAAQAIGYVQEGVYDVLITDFNTGRGSAFDLIQAATSAGIAKIVLVTGQDNDRAYMEIATQAAEAGATACFRKPYNMDRLLDAISPPVLVA